MTNQLLLRLRSDGALTWLTQQGESCTLAGDDNEMQLELAKAVARCREIVVLVPTAAVLLMQASVVSRNRAHLLKAIPYALEDQLASAVEDLHFALYAQVSGPQTGVAIVAREQMRAWLNQLMLHSIKPDMMIPESLAVSWKESNITVVIEDNGALIRASEWQCMSAEHDNLDQFIEILRATHDNPTTLEVFDFRQAPPLTLPSPLKQYHVRQREPLKFFGQGLSTPTNINLLQGEFAPSHRHVPLQTLWRYAAIIFTTVIGLSLTYAITDRWQLQHESNELEKVMRSVLHESFPTITRNDDPASVMHSELTRLRGGAQPSGLLTVLNQIAPILGSTTRIMIKGMEYRNSTLEIALHAPDVLTLDSLRERLAILPGLKVEVTAASPSDNHVEGRLRITSSGVK